MEASIAIVISLVLTAVLVYHLSFLLRKKRKTVFKQKRRETTPDDADVVIVGAGVLGAAMATVLARDGRRVIVIERESKETETITGEALMPGGFTALSDLGLGDVMHEVRDHVIDVGAKVTLRSGRSLDIPFPEKARTFHHGRFVTALRNAAKNEPNVTFIEGGSVLDVIADGDIVTGVRYKMHGQDDTKEVHAALTVVADGRYSKFRKLVSPLAPISNHVVFGSLLSGYQLEESSLCYYVVDLPCYLILYKISSSETRSMLFMSEPVPEDVSKYMQEDVASQLPENIREPFRKGVAEYGLQKARAHYLPPSLIQKPGVLVLGDAMNMRHPVTGGGQTVALNDLKLWRDLLRATPDLYDYGKLMDAGETFYKQRKNHAFVINTLAEVWATVYTTSDVHMKELKYGFFEYLALGGSHLKEPAAMFSACNLRPFVLIKHLLAGLAYSMLLIVRDKPFGMVPKSVMSAGCLFVKASVVTAKLLWYELLV